MGPFNYLHVVSKILTGESIPESHGLHLEVSLSTDDKSGFCERLIF